MATVFLILVVVLVVAGLVYGVVSLLSGDDPGLSAVEPDGRARPLPNNRSLSEFDLKDVRFDVGLRGYRMAQVDRVLRRTAYDLGYKDEMIAVLEAEVMALRDGRIEDAELLRKARESSASSTPSVAPVQPDLVVPEEQDFSGTVADAVDAAEPAVADDGEIAEEELPREGSLRRREATPDALDDSAPRHRAPEHIAPEHSAPDHGAPDGTDPDHAALEGTALDNGTADVSAADSTAAGDAAADGTAAGDTDADATDGADRSAHA
jgi:DivIVA domain-containing protein